MSAIEILNDSGAEPESVHPLELVSLPTGEILDTSVVARGGLDLIVKGYLRLANVMDPHQVADLYKKANPDSTLDGKWFDRNKIYTD